MKRNLKNNLQLYVMFLPVLIYLFINNYMPMFGLLMAFQEANFNKGILGGEWVGLQNFRFLFATTDAWVMTRNTILYNLVFLILTPVFAILVALCLNSVKSKIASRIYQTTILLPYLMSMVVVSYLVYAFLDPKQGMLNHLIISFGGKSIRWYSRAEYWPAILTFVNLWHSIGFSSVIYLSSIVGISNDYYEAAVLDGATRLQQIRYITLPLLKPTVLTMTIIGMGRIFRSDFGLFYQVPLDTGSLYSTTQTIDTYVYRALLKLGNIGMASAASFYQSIVGFVVVLGFNCLLKKVSPDEALF